MAKEVIFGEDVKKKLQKGGVINLFNLTEQERLIKVVIPIEKLFVLKILFYAKKSYV